MRVTARLLAGLVVLSAALPALPALAGSGRPYFVRTYPNLRSSDSVGDRDGSGGSFWFAQGDYDNATGGQIPSVVRLGVNGAVSTWLLDPMPQSFAPTALRRDPASGTVWVTVPLFAEGQGALYSLNTASGVVVRTHLPFPAIGLVLDTDGTPWATGTGKLAHLAGGALTIYDLANFGGLTSRPDAARRLWLETDNGTIASFSLADGTLRTYTPATSSGMRALDVDSGGRVWGIAAEQTRVLRWDPAAGTLTAFPLVNAAANWAGIGAGSGGRLHLVSAYGPHLLVAEPAKMADGAAVGILATQTAAVTGVGAGVTATGSTAVRADTTTPFQDRVLYAEDDAGRSLYSSDGLGLSTLVWSDGGELLAGAAPLQWWRPWVGDVYTTAMLPAVVEVRPGDPTNSFLTEVTITNVDADPSVDLAFATASATFKVTTTVPTGGSLVLPDAVAALRQLGAAVPSGATGTFGAAFANGRGTLAARVYTRFTNDTIFPAGSTTGLGFTSVDPQRELFVYRTTLNGLKNTSEFRTNISVANVCGEFFACPVLEMTAQFLDDRTGAVVGEKTLEVPPYALRQLDAPLASLGVTGETFSVRLQPYNAGWAGYDAYATVISNRVQDAAFIRASSVANSSTPTLPVVTDVIGAGGVHFVTECAITSTNPTTATADVTFTSAVSGNTVTEVLALEPGHGVRWPNAVDHFRQLAPSKIASSDYGPVRVAFRQYAGGVASARTTADNGTGLAFTAVDPYIERAVRTKRVIGLKETAAFRTNLAVVHLGPTTSDPTATIGVKVTVRNAAGQVVGSPLTRTLGPGQLFQWNKVLSEGLGVTGEGYTATVERTSGQDAFDAYVTIIDNVTTDATFLRAE